MRSCRMTADELKAWRERLHLTQREAAKALGISLSNYQLYERGQRFDMKRKVVIPKSIALACSAIAHGIPPYGK